MSKIAITIISVIVILYNSPNILAQTNPAALKKCPDGTSILASQSCSNKNSLGSAPKAIAPVALEKNEAKKLKKKNRADKSLCMDRSKLLPWKVRNMLDACDRLLSQESPLKKRPISRQALLQSRAIALINLNAHDLALEALDESDALGNTASYPLFDYSTGIGNKLIRSYILNHRGDKEAAFSLVNEVRNKRPYSKTILSGADSFEIAYDIKLDKLIKNYSQRVSLNPDLQRKLLFLHIINNDMQNAHTIGEQVSLINPRNKNSWKVSGEGDNASKLHKEIIHNAAKAYVFSINNETAKAEALLGRLDQDIIEYIGDDPNYIIENGVRKKAPKVKKSKLRKYNARKSEGTKLSGIVTDWRTLIKIRKSQPYDDYGSLVKDSDKLKHMVDIWPAYMDILNQYGLSGKPDAEKSKKLYDGLLNFLVFKNLKIDPLEIGQLIPANEYLHHIPKFKSDSLDWFWGGKGGYSQKSEKNTPGDVRTIRYTNEIATQAITEEMLLLAIAAYGKKDGKDSFQLLSHRTLARQITTSGTYIRTFTRDAGYEAQARVKFFTSEEAKLESPETQKHIMSIDMVNNELLPIYKKYTMLKKQ